MHLISTLEAGFAPSSVPWLLVADAVVKASILLGGAAVATLALRKASASVRHLIWTLALISALVVPVLSLALPRWRVPVVTVPSAALVPVALDEAPAPPALSRGRTGPATKQAAADGATVATAGPVLHSAVAERPSRVSWLTAAAAIWLGGFLFMMMRLAAGLLAVMWMSRRTEVVIDAPWLPLARRLAADLRVSPRVLFLRSPRATMPMAWGVLRPAVLMPADADDWPVERLRIVLLHELAHVRRRDCLTHLLAQAACAVYWFHPLAWMAAGRARAERERACDDLVLAAGTRGSAYAEELLHMARTMRAGRFPAVLTGATLAMAHRSQLEGRLLAILDPRIPRAGLTRLRMLAASAVCICAVVPLAAVQPWVDRAPQPVSAHAAVRGVSAIQMPNVATPATPVPQQPATPAAPRQAPQGMGTAPAHPDHEPEARSARETSHIVDGVLAATEASMHSAIEGVLATLGVDVQVPTGSNPNPNPNPDPKPQPNSGVRGSAARKADPRTVAALTAALKDTDREVRETALHALVQMRDPAIFDPLVQALHDADADVREEAAIGLGQLRDRRAIDPLVAALKDTHAGVREKAVFALGQLRDPRAIDSLVTMLKDTDAEVREQVAFALGQIRDRRATAALAGAITDVNHDVREQAVFALGQLRDAGAVDGLLAALRDAEPAIREQAAFALGQIRDVRAVDALIPVLKDSIADVRQQAVFALGQLRNGAAVEALVFALRDADAEVREQAAFALGQLRDPRAIDPLTAALKDAAAGVRQQAAFALGQLTR